MRVCPLLEIRYKECRISLDCYLDWKECFEREMKLMRAFMPKWRFKEIKRKVEYFVSRGQG